MTARKTARGIGVRAAVLLAGLLLVGFWLVSLAFKIAGAAIQLLLWAGLAVIVAGLVLMVAAKLRRKG
jgi:hypothetical protein